MRTTIALAALAASTFSLTAESAEVYTYDCKGRVVAVRMENVNAMTGTIAVDEGGDLYAAARSLYRRGNWSS